MGDSNGNVSGEKNWFIQRSLEGSGITEYTNLCVGIVKTPTGIIPGLNLPSKAKRLMMFLGTFTWRRFRGQRHYTTLNISFAKKDRTAFSDCRGPILLSIFFADKISLFALLNVLLE